MSGIVDFHSHILPGIDDGSASVEESIAMLKAEAAQGIRHVIATPHFYANHDTPERFLARRQEAENILREAMSAHEGLPRLSVGAEVHFFTGMRYSDALSALTIDEKRCILIEMPGVQWSAAMYDELVEIRSRQDLIPIVAHIDRYIRPLHTHRIPEQLEQLPVVVQANASFFMNPRTRRMAMKMLRKDQIQLLGSDCHNMTSRKPNLAEALAVIRKHFDDDILGQIRYYQDAVLQELSL